MTTPRDWEAEGIPAPPPPPGQRRNNGNGRYMPDPNRDARAAWAAARWTIDGWTMQEISDVLELGSKGNAHRVIQQGLRATREATAATTEQARAAHRTRLEYAIEEILGVIERDHVVVSHGRVVEGPGGQPLTDDGPLLAAVGKLKEVSESLRKLDGLDAPTQVQHSGDVTYQIVGVDPEALT